MLIKIKSVILSTMSMLLPASTAKAQVIQCTDPVGDVCLPDRPGGVVGQFENFSQLANYILTIGLTAAGLVAVIFVVVGGYRYVTAGGDEEKIKSAKGVIFNSLIGLVIVLLALAIVRITANLLSGSV